jgi:uncharacterized protein
MSDTKSSIPTVNVSRVLKGATDVSEQGTVSHLEFSVPTPHGQETTVIPLANPAQWRVTVSHVDNNEYWLAGRVRAELNLECSRCLIPVVHSAEARLESLLRFKQNIKVPIREVTDDEEEVIFFGDHELDLTSLLAEALSFEIPDAVLHDPNCKGLCRACGTNLNLVEPCPDNRADCPQLAPKEKTNNPFAALLNQFED